MAERKKLQVSEQERKRRSELAKKLNKEGKFGGKQEGAGRPAKQRAQEIVAEKIQAEANNIFKALKAALTDEKAPSIRLKAALEMLNIEQREYDYKAREENRLYDNLSKEALLKLIVQRFAELEAAGVDIPYDFEGSAKDITPKELDG